MSSTLDIFEQPIVAVALESIDGELNFIHFDDSISIKDLDFQEDLLRIDNLYIVHDWFTSIIVCTEEILEELQRNL